MSVRFQYAGDKDISVGRAGGASLFKLPGAISFPPAGSYNSTLFGETYPTAEGGTSFTNPANGAAPPIPNQIVDVDVLNDGSGGTYIDWSSATNLQYNAYGVVFLTETAQPLNIEVPTSSGNYYQGGTYDNQYFHDGVGGWASGGVNSSYYSNGTDTNIALIGTPQTTEVPSGSGNYYDNGQIDGYTWNGSGGYNYPVTKGAYWTTGDTVGLSGLNVVEEIEVPTGGSLYGTGRTVIYTWDGSGGYNYPVYDGSYYPVDTLIWESVTYTSGSTDVPSGSGNYYDNTLNGDQYLWNGSGGYSYNSNWYYPYGTVIYNDGTYEYRWDGVGGYYSITL